MLSTKARARRLPGDGDARRWCARRGRSTRWRCTSISTGSTRGPSGCWAGVEPYEGADADARAVDTRRGEPGPIATRIDRALRARFRDETLKHRVIQYLMARTKAPVLWEEIEAAAREIDPLLDESQAPRRSSTRSIDGVAYVEAGGRPYDKTELLLSGRSGRRWRWCATRAR